MQKEEQQLEKRLSELSNLAYSRDIVTYSDFLNLNELNILHSMPKDRLYTKFVTFGGYGLAERQMAAFLPDALSLRGEMSWCSEEEWGDYPFDILRISPLHAKYAEQLTHRDYLGTILGLGIERAKIGDILVDGTDAVVFVHRTLQSFLMEELTRVRHTQVLVKEISREDFQYEPKYEEIRGTVASVRLDSLLSLAFSASRTKLSGLIEGAKVFVNGKLITTNSYQLKENDVISVRGYGKFRYNGTGAKTKMAGGYLSERSGSFDYNTGSISVSVSGKPWGCIWNPAESADCICSWSIVDFFCGRLHLRENSAEKKICSVKSMCDPSGIRRHRKSDRSSGKELRSGFLLFQPD